MTAKPCPVCGAEGDQPCFTVTPSDPRQRLAQPHSQRVFDPPPTDEDREAQAAYDDLWR